MPAAAKIKDENYAKRLALDPETKCYLPGVPRATYMPYPFQILQSAQAFMIAYEYAGAARNINMGKPKEPPTDSWMGWSNGHWDGDTLVVDVTGLNDSTWFDRAGDFHSDSLHVVERYTPVSADTIQYEATIDDPKTFLAPLEDQHAALPASGKKPPVDGIQMRGNDRRAALRPPAQRAPQARLGAPS